MDILNLFEYKDGDLIICEKWTINTSLGKKVGKGVYIDKIYYKKENIIWRKHYGDIPKDKVIKFVNKNDYRIENLFLGEYEYSNGRPIGSVDKKKRMVKNSLSIEDERYIRNNWGKEGINSFMKKFNISKCTIMSIKKEMNLPNKLSIANSIKYKINIEDNINLCGVYAIITKDIYKIGYNRIKDKIIILDSGCWEVDCSKYGSGYKYISINGKKVVTHRIMFYYKNPNIDESMIIRHKCNNKCCCNPDHLLHGSCKDNLLDIKKEEMDSFKDIYINSSGDIELLSKTLNIEIKTVKSRIYKMELNKKYGKPKRLKIQKSEV